MSMEEQIEMHQSNIESLKKKIYVEENSSNPSRTSIERWSRYIDDHIHKIYEIKKELPKRVKQSWDTYLESTFLLIVDFGEKLRKFCYLENGELKIVPKKPQGIQFNPIVYIRNLKDPMSDVDIKNVYAEITKVPKIGEVFGLKRDIHKGVFEKFVISDSYDDDEPDHELGKNEPFTYFEGKWQHLSDAESKMQVTGRMREPIGRMLKTVLVVRDDKGQYHGMAFRRESDDKLVASRIDLEDDYRLPYHQGVCDEYMRRTFGTQHSILGTDVDIKKAFLDIEAAYNRVDNEGLVLPKVLKMFKAY